MDRRAVGRGGERTPKIVNILHILPEFDEGGVERHVLSLANGQKKRGHTVFIVSAGGKLEGLLRGVVHRKLPAHRKNPLTGAYCAFRTALLARKEMIDVVHAHSRVPAWIAWWTSSLTGIPWLVTCHAYYSGNAGLIPYGRAKMLLCVSEGVRDFFATLFPEMPVRTVYNGLERTDRVWKGASDSSFVRFLFVGRLTEKKGLHVVMEALGPLKDFSWTLDVVGDGPKMETMKGAARRLGIDERVRFLGFRDEPEQWMEACSCFLFPSLEEGMGLTLMRAISMKVPILSSDLPPVRELARGADGLIPPGDVAAWTDALRSFVETRTARARFDREKIPSIGDMVSRVDDAYTIVLHR